MEVIAHAGEHKLIQFEDRTFLSFVRFCGEGLQVIILAQCISIRIIVLRIILRSALSMQFAQVSEDVLYRRNLPFVELALRNVLQA